MDRLKPPPPDTSLYFLTPPPEKTENAYYVMVWISGRERLAEDIVLKARDEAGLEQRASVGGAPWVSSVHFEPPVSPDEAMEFARKLAPLIGDIVTLQAVNFSCAGNPSEQLAVIAI